MNLNKISKIFVALGIMALPVAGLAAPTSPNITFKKNDITIDVAFNDTITQKFDAEITKVDTKSAYLRLNEIGNEDLEKIIAKIPNARRISIDSSKLTSIEPLKKLQGTTSVYIKAHNVADFTPLANITSLTEVGVESKIMPDIKWAKNLTNLRSMSLKDSTVLTSLEGLPSSQTLKTLHISKSKLTDVSQITNAPNLDMFQLIMGGVTDLTPFGSLTTLTNMDLYGCDVKDLTPLSKIPTLKKLNLYGTDNTDYTTLANLKQVQEVELGATKLPSLAFIKDMPALKSLSTFNNEELADLSPISGTGIEYLKIWMLKYPVDLNQIKDATKMKKIEITGCNTGVPVSNFAALSNMKELAEIKISGLKDRCNTEVDGNFAKGLTKVKTLYLDSIHNLTNTEAFGDMVNLEKAWLLELNGTFDVSFFGRMPSLKEVHIKKTAVTGLESLAKCSNLQTLDIAEVTDKKVIDAVKALPKLQSLTVSKSFSDADLQGFANPKIRITKR